MAEAAPNYSGSPQVFSGARARFKFDGVTVGYAAGVSGEETVDYEPVEVLDLLEVREHVPVAYRTSLNAQIFRVFGDSLKNQGIFPRSEEILTRGGLTAIIEDKLNTGRSLASFAGVKTSGHTFDVTARGIVSENVSFVAIKVRDESE